MIMSVTATCDVSQADRNLALCAGLGPKAPDMLAQEIIARLECQTTTAHALMAARTAYDQNRSRWLNFGDTNALVSMVLAMTDTYPDLDNIAREPWPGQARPAPEVANRVHGERWHVFTWRALCWLGSKSRCACQICESAHVKMRGERKPCERCYLAGHNRCTRRCRRATKRRALYAVGDAR